MQKNTKNEKNDINEKKAKYAKKIQKCMKSKTILNLQKLKIQEIRPSRIYQHFVLVIIREHHPYCREKSEN